MTRVLASCLLVGYAACGGAPDPCAELGDTCLALHLSSETVEQIDQLELDILYGSVHATTTTQTAGGTAALPVVTAVELEGTAQLRVGIVAAGKLGGNVLGTGAVTVIVEPGVRDDVTIELAPAVECTPGGLYCGGDKVAGDSQTLYVCNGGGVPLARGVCEAGCVTEPTRDDGCKGIGGTCVDGGFYCGGDKLDGDPQSLYRCASGAGVDRVTCANGCVVAPPGTDDYCR